MLADEESCKNLNFLATNKKFMYNYLVDFPRYKLIYEDALKLGVLQIFIGIYSDKFNYFRFINNKSARGVYLIFDGFNPMFLNSPQNIYCISLGKSKKTLHDVANTIKYFYINKTSSNIWI